MGSPILAEFKRQASFYLKEKIKTARLALTDVTPAQLCSFNWGLTLANLSLKVIKLIEDGEFLMEERTRKRRLMRGIQGFGRRFNNEHPSTSSSSSSDTDDLDSDDGSQSQSPDSTGAGILLKAITRWNSSCDLPKLRLHSYTELPQDEPSAEDEEHEGFPTIEGDHPLLVNSDIQP
ncbi:unnamed protein product [Linum tenue]|uniref:Uncharacterized protein n=1 Tax=Linum tenue TaxID=586396 RepID=A0AAV0MAC1_9ROSI|nr:unnamed protein product [Linum tenue]